MEVLFQDRYNRIGRNRHGMLTHEFDNGHQRWTHNIPSWGRVLYSTKNNKPNNVFIGYKLKRSWMIPLSDPSWNSVIEVRKLFSGECFLPDHIEEKFK